MEGVDVGVDLGTTVMEAYRMHHNAFTGAIEKVTIDGIGAWFLSARTGWSGAARWGNWRAWLGAARLTTDRTITIRQESPDLGTVTVEVDQRPVDPVTYQVGGGVGFGKRWEVMVEAGSNFDDAFMGVFSASFRF